MVEDEEGSFRDRIATVNEEGKRNWIYPKKPKGRFFNYRQIVAYSLLLFLFAAPHIYVNGKQLLLFNLIERKFIIFGKVFWPQDLWLFAITLILLVIFVIFFTIIFGRLFCGWLCPQTIFMEMVFRRIEYWIDGDFTHQKKLDKAPWNREKIIKRVAKHTIFWIISFLIANTFLAYIIGSERLWEIQTSGIGEHFGGFIAIVIFTTVFYLVFARLREQVCTTICPYGRLQGVLLDGNSMVVTYNYIRGESRAKFRKNEDRKEASKGDCIDCYQCVNVCPTGIDIRNGTQLECVNCTACIDVCDDMMESVGQEKGLIGFQSENGIKTGMKFQWTRRVKSYSVLLIIVLGLLVAALISRKDFESTIFRQRGSTFQIQDGFVTNIFEINLTNKTDKQYDVKIELDDKTQGEIIQVVDKLTLKGESILKERFIIKYPFKGFEQGLKKVKLNIYGNGELIERTSAKLIGPIL